MRFEHPEHIRLLWFIPAILIFLWIGARLRRRQLGKLGKASILKVTAPLASGARNLRHAVILVAIWLLLTAAIMRPQWGYEWVVKRDRGSDLVVVVDVSRSMNAADFSPSRMVQAKREVIDLIGMLRGERVALVAFAGFSQLLCPLTLDYDAFTIFLDYLDTDLIPVQGTNLGDALKDAISAFELESARAKNILVITDGEDHEDTVLAAIEKAKSSQIKISVLGLGTPDGAPIPLDEGGFKKDGQGNLVLSKLDGTVLKNIAEQTGGKYVHSVPGDMDLAALYKNGISRDLGDDGEQEEKERRYFERFQIFVAFALLLLLLDTIGLPRFGTLVLVWFLVSFSPPLHAGPLRDGVRAYENKEYNDALTNFLEGQVDKPSDPQIQYNLGNTLYRMGRFKEAAEAFEKAESTDDKNLKQNTLFNHGNALLQQKEFKKAIDKYENAIELNNKDMDAVYNRDLARKLLEQKQQQEQQQKSSDQGQQSNEQQSSENQSQQQDGDSKQQESQSSQNQQEGQEQNQAGASQSDLEQQGDVDMEAFDGAYSDNPDEQEAKQWLSTVEENAKRSLQQSLRSRMWKKTPPATDW